jgi:hypothetical protein
MRNAAGIATSNWLRFRDVLLRCSTFYHSGHHNGWRDELSGEATMKLFNASNEFKCTRGWDSFAGRLFCKIKGGAIPQKSARTNRPENRSKSMAILECGGPGSCDIVAPKQRLGVRCGRKGVVDVQKEFSAAPARRFRPYASESRFLWRELPPVGSRSSMTGFQ